VIFLIYDISIIGSIPPIFNRNYAHYCIHWRPMAFVAGIKATVE